MHFFRQYDPRGCSPMGRGWGGPGGRHGFGGGRHGHGGHGGRDGPFGGGRGGRRRLFGGDELKLMLLNLISVEPRHGYDLIREIEALSGSAYAPSPGVIYPTLTLLTDMGYISEQPGEGSRKLFAITPAGTAFLEENRDTLADAMERLEALAKMSERTDGAPIRRAMQNLAMALRTRLEKEGADADTMLDVAALIDEAASKIERLK
ncbi:PadR family transcriptional regulator [Sphingobium aquiterrae]|uniref:PadR family transcriptional regulator n=1 Tax=Sphingobium aquiterrae TaxID=2038656 RepID=UPI003019FF0F